MLEPSQPLSRENLKEHNRVTLLGTSDEMDPGVPASFTSEKKRSSRQSSVADTNQETASVRSQQSQTAANYRFITLRDARIRIQLESPPEEIQNRINAIIQRDIPHKRKQELECIAKILCSDFIDVLSGASSEDDYIARIFVALSSMDNTRKLGFKRKAGIVCPVLLTHILLCSRYLRLGTEFET